MQVKIKDYQDEQDTKMVGFEITYKEREFNIDKFVPLKEGTTREENIDSAWNMAEPEINKWKSDIDNTGLFWNPITKELSQNK